MIRRGGFRASCPFIMTHGSLISKAVSKNQPEMATYCQVNDQFHIGASTLASPMGGFNLAGIAGDTKQVPYVVVNYPKPLHLVVIES